MYSIIHVNSNQNYANNCTNKFLWAKKNCKSNFNLQQLYFTTFNNQANKNNYMYQHFTYNTMKDWFKVKKMYSDDAFVTLLKFSCIWVLKSLFTLTASRNPISSL